MLANGVLAMNTFTMRHQRRSRRAPMRTRHRSRADIWARLSRKITVGGRRGSAAPRAPRATQVIVSGPEFSVRFALIPCAGCGEVLELRHGARSRRDFVVAATGIGEGSEPHGRIRDWWEDE
jgi:hypothetical protein